MVGILLLFPCVSFAQYFQFSQYNFTTARVNPAMFGLTSYASVDFDSRSQKTGGDFNINSNFVSLTYPLLNQSTGQPWSGFNVSAVDDRSGGIFKTQEIALSYALHVQLAKRQLLSFGVKGLYQSSWLSMAGFYTGSQYVPDRGFNSGASTGETFDEARTHYGTFSFGLYWQEVDRQGTPISYWGATLFDINQPQYSFVGSTSQLPATFTLSGGFRAYKNGLLNLFPEMLYTRNATNNVLNAGLRVQRDLNATRNKTPDHVDVLLKYVAGRSGIAGIQLHRENLSVGLSYDFPLLSTNPGNQGALEVGLSLRKLVIPRMRRIAKRRQDERKKAAERAAASKKTATTKTSAVKSTTPKKDSAAVAAIQPLPVEITPRDSASSRTEVGAKAGRISQDPMVVEKITLRFHFEYNSTDLDDETEEFLTGLSTTLKEDPTLKLRITGHTDNIGPDKFNQKLSLKRAEAVKSFLLSQGIESNRLETLGKGMNEPLNSNSTDAERSKNRRVELLLYHDY